MDVVAREKTAMHEVTTRLLKTYGGDHTPEEITYTVEAIHHRFEGRPVRDFVPVLVERHARRELSR